MTVRNIFVHISNDCKNRVSFKHHLDFRSRLLLGDRKMGDIYVACRVIRDDLE